jgi:hypothetical protein
MPRVFISYRRADNRYVVDRIYDRLVSEFGQRSVFKDVDSIPLGADFREVLEREVGHCHAILVVIGSRWLDITGPQGSPKILAADDYVRIEVEIALARGIPVIPVLVDGANMPNSAQLPPSLQALAFRNATQVRPDPDFHRDVDRLLRAIPRITQAVPSPVEPKLFELYDHAAEASIGEPAQSSTRSPRPGRSNAPPKPPPAKSGRARPLTILWLIAFTTCLLLAVGSEVFNAVDQSDRPLRDAGANSEQLTTGSWQVRENNTTLTSDWFDSTFSVDGLWTFYRDGQLKTGGHSDKEWEYKSGLLSSPNTYTWTLDGERLELVETHRDVPKRFTLILVSVSDTSLVLRRDGMPKKGVESPTMTLKKLPRLIDRTPRAYTYSHFVPTGLAVGVIGLSWFLLRRTRWWLFTVCLVATPILGALLGAGFGYLVGMSFDEKGSFVPLWVLAGLSNLVWCLPITLTLAIIVPFAQRNARQHYPRSITTESLKGLEA